jgi:hypothetical protein
MAHSSAGFTLACMHSPAPAMGLSWTSNDGAHGSQCTGLFMLGQVKYAVVREWRETFATPFLMGATMQAQAIWFHPAAVIPRAARNPSAPEV